jgi:hypothetical protein
MSQEMTGYGNRNEACFAQLSTTIVSLIGALLGTPEQIDELSQLWQFLFLSHPAACTYLNYRIAGHNDWIDSSMAIIDSRDLSSF